MRLTVIRAIPLKNFGHFQGGSWHLRLRGARLGDQLLRLLPRPCQELLGGTGGSGDLSRRNRRVARGGLDVVVTQQYLNDPRIDALTTGAAAAVTLSPDKTSICSLLAAQTGGETVAQGMRGDPFGQRGQLPGLAAGSLERARARMTRGVPGGEQPIACGAPSAEVEAQNLQQPGRQHGVTVFTAFAQFDAQQHAG